MFKWGKIDGLFILYEDNREILRCSEVSDEDAASIVISINQLPGYRAKADKYEAENLKLSRQKDALLFALKDSIRFKPESRLIRAVKVILEVENE